MEMSSKEGVSAVERVANCVVCRDSGERIGDGVALEHGSAVFVVRDQSAGDRSVVTEGDAADGASVTGDAGPHAGAVVAGEPVGSGDAALFERARARRFDDDVGVGDEFFERAGFVEVEHDAFLGVVELVVEVGSPVAQCVGSLHRLRLDDPRPVLRQLLAGKWTRPQRRQVEHNAF